MQKLLKDYLDEVRRKQRKRRKAGIAAALVAVMVVGTVIWSLAQAGIAMTGEPKCGLEEHEHSDACYEDAIICGMEESAGHTHTEECYQTPEPTLICGQEESEEHTHTEECYQTAEPVLICGQEESEGHIHTDACHGRQLICGKEEHKHTDECFIDKSADVEDASVWDAQYADTEWKESWGENLVVAAEKQIGYKESEKNYTIAEDGSHKGYTRYGQFAVNAGMENADVYADWDAAFVNFCIHYAGLEESQMFPNKVKTSEWHEEFITVGEGMNTVYLTAPEGYEPQAGDIIFFNKENEETETQMGIVSSYDKEKNELKVIEGNSANEVKENKYDLNSNDTHITEYLKIAEMEEAYKNRDAEPSEEVTEEPVAEEEPEETSEKRTMTAEGSDYTITVSFTEEAGIPEDAELIVQEIEQDSEEYQQYYKQSLEAADAEEFSFARYFDITFLVDGQKIEPSAPIEVTVSYKDEIEMDEENSGKAVHFAAEGTEVLDAEVDSDGKEFKFTQESFSVTGTAVIATPAAVYYKTSISNTANLAGKEFLIAASGSVMTSKEVKDANSVSAMLGEAFTEDDGTVYTNATVWSFVGSGSSYKLKDRNNKYLKLDTNGNLTLVDANNATNFTVTRNNDGTVKILISATSGGGGWWGQTTTYYYIKPNGVYTGKKFEEQKCFLGSSGTDNSSLTLYTADETRADYKYIVLNPYNVSKDGSDKIQYDFKVDNDTSTAKRCRIPVADDNSTNQITITLPSNNTRTNFEVTADGTTHKIEDNGAYKWVLIGWYNIGDGEYYDVSNGPREVTVNLTNNNVFYARWIASDEALNNGKNASALGGYYSTVDTSSFATIQMFDYDELFNLSQLDVISHGTSYERWQEKAGETDPFTFYSYRAYNHGNYPGLAGIGNSLTNYGEGKVENENDPLLQRLFNTEANINSEDGVHYLGTGNYLFSYNENTGYYEYDSSHHAASYNKDEERFYVYNDPQVRSDKNDETLFIPLNGEGSFGDATPGTTNYWFGMKTEFNFWLPDASGSNGNKNKGEDMVFEFSGDDDVWVFVDGELVLDLSGIHGEWDGSINFSNGTVKTKKESNENTTTLSLSQGAHTMKIYYMERGRGGSNCKIKFNFLPVWSYEGEPAQAIEVNKVWQDASGDPMDSSEEEIQVELSSENSSIERQSLNEGNDWEYNWKYLDKGKQYTVEEDTTNISDSYVTSTDSEPGKCGYWIESSKLAEGDIIIIGNGKITDPSTGLILSVENEIIDSSHAEFAVKGDVLKDESALESGKWIVHIIEERNSGNRADNEGGHIQFKLESLQQRGHYLNIRNRAEGYKLVNSSEDASILHFSEKGNLTGSYNNRLVCSQTFGFELVTKDDTANDGVDSVSGRGSYRRVHLYKYFENVGNLTTYTITNKRVEAKIKLEKVNKNTGEGLGSGAKFKLYKNPDCTEPVKGMEEITIGADSTVMIEKLPVGIYYLKETKAPGGYQLLTEPIIVTVSKSSATGDAKGVVEVDYQIEDWGSNNDHVIKAEDGTVTIKIPNTMLYSLPETGGSGIYLYMFSGVLLMAGAVLMTYKNKQRRKGVLRS